jgi:thioredoxin-like negative regulator of GroEL
MKKHHRLTVRAIVFHSAFCILHSAFISPAYAQDVNWRSDYNRARQEAAEKGLPLIVDIGTENCYWCKQLDLRTFKEPNLAAYLNERTIPLRVDATRAPALAEALNIQSYPTIVFAGPDGRILGVQEGFVEAPQLREQVMRTVAMVVAPEWMQRDYEDATKAFTAGESAKALALLRNVVDDGKERPVQVKARQMLQELEQKAATRLAEAKALTDRAKSSEALTRLTQSHAGTAAARDAAQLLAARAEAGDTNRARRARELLSQAKEDYRTQQFSCCMDRCELLTTQFGDLPEGGEALRLEAELKSNPEWMKLACDQLGDRLGVLYLGLAEDCLKKGQPQQATFYLERILRAFPNSRHAEAAQMRLSQMQGGPTRSVDLKR